MIKKKLVVTGLPIEAEYTELEVQSLFIPLLEELSRLKAESEERVLVYLAAPPGTGKTTLSLFLEALYKEKSWPYTFQSISMDGFHRPNRYLDSHAIKKNGKEVLLRQLKGAPETFDVRYLEEKMKALKSQPSVQWPIYDRRLHDVSDDMLQVDADIVLIEGNYLLLDKPSWRQLSQHADQTIFIKAPLELLKNRIIDRKLKGGHNREEAEAHYNRADLLNHRLVINHSKQADWEVTLTADGRLKWED